MKTPLSKRHFADTFERMLADTPIEKIRVTHLAKAAGTSPQAFYYHFQDKYDLVAWIYLQDFNQVSQQTTKDFSQKQLADMLEAIQQRKDFYQKAFTDHSQNAITAFAIAHMMAHIRIAVADWQGSPITTDQELAARYHQYGVFGLFIDWLFDRLSLTMDQVAHFQYQQMPSFLKEALATYDFKNFA